MFRAPFPEPGENVVEVQVPSDGPIVTTERERPANDGKGRVLTFCAETGTSDSIPNVKIEIADLPGSEVSVLLTPTKNGYEVLYEERYLKPVVSDFILRLIGDFSYPTRLLGGNQTKEMIEMGVALYYLRNTIRKFCVPKAGEQSFMMIGAAVNSILDDPTVTCIIPGDGVGPRIGWMVASWTKWQVVSVDPIMNTDRTWDRQPPKNLKCVCGKIEDVDFEQLKMSGKQRTKVAGAGAASAAASAAAISENTTVDPLMILLHVHSHSDFPDCWDKMAGRRIGISLPCCPGIRHTLGKDVQPIARFTDPELARFTNKAEVVIYTKDV